MSFDNIRDGWSQSIMLCSDQHADSALSDRALEDRHLAEAEDRNAIIMSFGDLFDAMQGKYDPRASKAELRKEDLNSSYFDTVLNNIAKRYEPHAARWAFMSIGNHESSVIDRHGTNLVDRLAEKMRAAGGQTLAGPYSGFIRISFTIQKTLRQSMIIYYHHGSGGGAPMTHGTLDTRRQASFLTDADIVVNGHTHSAYVVPIKRIGITDGGKISETLQDHIRIPGYKIPGSWETEKGHMPKSRGCAWLDLSYERGRVRKRVQVVAE